MTPQAIRANIVMDDAGCWIWQGPVGKHGYGLIYGMGPHPRGAHRESYIAHHGEIPEGLYIDHKCRQPRCVNPVHLEAVTQQENMRRSAASRMRERQEMIRIRELVQHRDDLLLPRTTLEAFATMLILYLGVDAESCPALVEYNATRSEYDPRTFGRWLHHRIVAMSRREHVWYDPRRLRIVEQEWLCLSCLTMNTGIGGEQACCLCQRIQRESET